MKQIFKAFVGKLKQRKQACAVFVLCAMTAIPYRPRLSLRWYTGCLQRRCANRNHGYRTSRGHHRKAAGDDTCRHAPKRRSVRGAAAIGLQLLLRKARLVATPYHG
jgi:hypothetical protein